MMGPIIFSPTLLQKHFEHLSACAAAAAGANGRPGVIDTGVAAHPVVSIIEHFREPDERGDDDLEVRVDWQETDFDESPAAILRIGSTGNGLVARQGPRGAELHIRGEGEVEAVRYALRRLLDELDSMDGTYATADPSPEQAGPVSQAIPSDDRIFGASRPVHGRYGTPSFPAAVF
jgi:hypothetical protein